MGLLRIIGNVLWFLLAGLWLALGYVFAGVMLCITIIGIPFGLQAFKLAQFVLWPFGKTVGRAPTGGCLEVVFNVLWLVVFGWGIFVAHLIAGLLLCLTIVGIPFGLQAFKISGLALWPFGRTVVDVHSTSQADSATYASTFSVPADPTGR